ncbi:hypothetical protein O1B81_003560 [Vibrio cholerae]|nr:hypothetical protein [Vibrio cholerae]
MKWKIRKSFLLLVMLIGGKSKTLKALTDDNRYVKNYHLGGCSWFIRRMSNDDQPGGYYDFMENFSQSHLIAAFCPNFDEERKDKTTRILQALKKRGYELHFWVIEKQFTTNAVIGSECISKLNNFGSVEVYSEKTESKIRAAALKKYIQAHA